MTTEVLKPSTHDMVALAEAVATRLADCIELHTQTTGMPPRFDTSFQKDVVAWSTMHTRHCGGDFRNTESEKAATRVVAQWTLDTNAVLRGQTPQQMKWKD